MALKHLVIEQYVPARLLYKEESVNAIHDEYRKRDMVRTLAKSLFDQGYVTITKRDNGEDGVILTAKVTVDV